MNKNDLVAHVAETVGITKADSARIVDTLLDGITTGLKKNGEVRLVGFGNFVVSTRAASKGRNPRTGEEIQIPPTKSVKFKVGKQLKEDVNK